MIKILNASEPGLGSSMTEEETRDFLSNTKLFARLGTIDEKTDPNVHPVWYYFDNERIYFQTGKNSKKLRNIKKRNNIYFCIDQTNLPYKRVSDQQLMGGIYSLNEQETTNFPPVVWVCIVVRCTTYYKRAYVECYKNIWISNVILYETLIVL